LGSIFVIFHFKTPFYLRNRVKNTQNRIKSLILRSQGPLTQWFQQLNGGQLWFIALFYRKKTNRRNSDSPDGGVRRCLLFCSTATSLFFGEPFYSSAECPQYRIVFFDHDPQ